MLFFLHAHEEVAENDIFMFSMHFHAEPVMQNAALDNQARGGAEESLRHAPSHGIPGSSQGVLPFAGRHPALCVSTSCASGLRAALNNGVVPDSSGEDGMPLLSLCAERLWLDGVRLMLEFGAAPRLDGGRVGDAPVDVAVRALVAGTLDAELDEIMVDVERAGDILDLLLQSDAEIRLHVEMPSLSEVQAAALTLLEDRLRLDGRVQLADDVGSVSRQSGRLYGAGVCRAMKCR